jgi:luciferase family oxidoreductase group 1
MKLSVLDVMWPGYLPHLVPLLDELGYHRYWASEHHTSDQSASPTLMTALAAGLSDRMRVGTAGVLLRVAHPVRAAEDFRLLGLFFGDRIDAGVAGNVPGDPMASALRTWTDPSADDYADRVEILVRLLRSEPLPDGNVLPVGPVSDAVPEVWVCGTGESSALLAARLGTCYGFHHYLSAVIGVKDPFSVVKKYRDAFQPSPFRQEPQAIAACYGMCAPTAERAHELWTAQGAAAVKSLGGDPSTMTRPAPDFLGPADACAEALTDVAAGYGVDEIVLDCLTHDLEARCEGLELLSQVFGLRQAAAAEEAEADDAADDDAVAHQAQPSSSWA